jgi:hypothetical protein
LAQRTAAAPAPATAAEWPRPGSVTRIDDSSTIKTGYLNDVSIAAVRDFTRRFKTGAAPYWLKLTDGGWAAKFDESHIKYLVSYTRNGNWTYTIREYSEKQLPREVRHLIRSTYYDYAITGVSEVEQYNIAGIVYITYLEDETSFLSIMVHEGEITVREHFNKPAKIK